MWLSLISLIGGPVVSGLIEAYKAHLNATTADHQVAADLAGKEIAAQTQVKLAEVGHPFEPEKLGFYVVLVYFAKCVIWDTMLGLGTTPPLYGYVATWASLIMTFYFGKRTIENVMRIIRR